LKHSEVRRLERLALAAWPAPVVYLTARALYDQYGFETVSLCVYRYR
jgi:hypothetical protein